jgi:hypothetical protein
VLNEILNRWCQPMVSFVFLLVVLKFVLVVLKSLIAVMFLYLWKARLKHTIRQLFLKSLMKLVSFVFLLVVLKFVLLGSQPMVSQRWGWYDKVDKVARRRTLSKQNRLIPHS